MAVNSVSTYQYTLQARADLARLQNELIDLTRQTGSGRREDSLRGYGTDSSRILSAKGLIAQTDSYAQSAKTLSGRLEATDSSLGQVSDAAEDLRLAVLNALGNDDGQYLADTLQTSFDAARTALNVTYEGEALFGGERVGAKPVNVDTLDQLAAAATTADIYDVSARPRTADLGDGAFNVAERANDVSQPLFEAMRTLKAEIDAAGGTLPKPLTAAQRTTLETLAADLESARKVVTVAQGRNGDLQKRVEADETRLVERSDALTKLLGDVADADLSEVATKVSLVQTQYEAVASVFSQVSQLSLLDYL